MERHPYESPVAGEDFLDRGQRISIYRQVVAEFDVMQPPGCRGAPGVALSTWLGLSGIGACRGWVGWVSVVWVRLRQSVR